MTKNIKETWEKKSIESILKESISINTDIAAVEVLEWLIGNVENFIDNSQKIFRLNLILDNNEMPELKKLQDLYRAIPDEEKKDNSLEESLKAIKLMEECTECREELHQITKKIHDKIRKSNELLDKLFKRMSFYYEKLIVTSDNRREALKIDEELKLLAKQLNDSKDEEKEKIQKQINETIAKGMSLVKYEELNGSVDITMFDYEAFDVGVTISHNMNESSENYIIPEGFACYLEISYYNKLKPTTMF